MFKHKDYVLTIYEEGKFTKAAEKLFLSQPSLSATIKRIEDKLGAPIFDRSCSPVELTDIGKEYLEYAKRIKELEDSFEKYVSNIGNLITGKLRIGGSSFFSSFILPDMISRFNKQHSNINFEVYEDNTKNLISKLKDGLLDIILDNAIIEDDKISSEPYLNERLLLAVPKKFEVNEKLLSYRLTAEQIKNGEYLTKKAVDLTNFKNFPFILLRHENDTGRRAEKIINKYDLGSNILFYLDQQVTSYNLACTGVGLAFLGDALVKKVANTSELYYYVLQDRIAMRNIYFYYKKNQYMSLACKKFIEYNVQKNNNVQK